MALIMDGKGLMRLRTLLDLRQGEFGQRLGISQAAVSQFERGVRQVPRARERQIERMLLQPRTDERE
jgi:transcriptional regulator with XRE-family HTH domain